MRTFVSFPAGTARMNFARFSAYTFLGCVPWVLALTYLGYVLGENWEEVGSVLHYLDYAVALALVAGVAYLLARQRSSRTSGSQDHTGFPGSRARRGGFEALRATLTGMDRGLVSDGAASGRPATGVPETRSTASRQPQRRLRGIDAARAIAVLGMVMVHFGPNPTPDTALGNLYGVSYGRASVLFVLLAGVGVALLVGGRSHGRPSLARGRLVLRGALLLPLGLWLQELDHGVFVILQYYALYFLFAAVVLTFPDRWLLAGGVVVLIGGPIVYLWGGMLVPEWFVREEAASLDDPVGKIADDLLLTGAYPLVTWAAPLLVGLWIGRRDLAAPTVRWGLLVLGLVVAVTAALAAGWLSAAFGEAFEKPGGAGFAHLLTDEPHSEMPLWMLGSIGSACAVLGGMLLLAERLPRVTWPLAATGQLALTVYVGHLLLLSAYPELLKREAVPAAFLTVGAFMLLVAAACMVWRAVLPRGPLEAAFAAPWWIVERFVQPAVRPRAPTGRRAHRPDQ